MNVSKSLVCTFVLFCVFSTFSQIDKIEKDNQYLQQVEENSEPDKVLHAEPLYIDLIRDLGARKGEKEWNVGLGLTDNLTFDVYEALIEYEWAPINRLGVEVELPFTFYSSLGQYQTTALSDKLNSLKVATQWSFLVDQKMALSMAIGCINEFKLSDFSNFGKPLIKGNIYNPFLVAAKRWGSNFHTLVYTGPHIEQDFKTNTFNYLYAFNTSIHYMITGTRNFIGVEMNKTINGNDFDMTLRPQMRLGITNNLMMGIVAGVPISRENERLSAFIRLIWEPKHY